MNTIMEINAKNICKVIILLSLSLPLIGNASSIINGLAIHSELGQESFIAGLFTSYPSADARDILTSDTDKQIQVRVLTKRLSARRFKRMWIEGMAINASASDLANQSKNMAEFSNLLKVTLIDGDIFAIQRTGDSVKILINGSTLGSIEDPSFFDLLLRTWIGGVPLSSQFRDNLLLEGNLDQELLARFNAIRPTEERIVAVAEALEASNDKKQAKEEKKVAVSIQPQIAQPTIDSPPAPTISADTTASTAEPANEKKEDPQQVETPSSSSPAEAAPAQEIVSEEQSTEASNEIAQVEQEQTKANEPAETESLLEEDEEEFTAESLLAQQLYISQLKRWVYKKLKYPIKSVERSEEGIVRMEVSINRDGSLAGVILVQEAKYSRLNKAAMKAVEKASPYPKFPDSIKEEVFSFSLPVVFRLVSG